MGIGIGRGSIHLCKRGEIGTNPKEPYFPVRIPRPLALGLRWTVERRNMMLQSPVTIIAQKQGSFPFKRPTQPY